MAKETLYLETTAIILAALSGLYGIYFVLFILALWSTYRNGGSAASRGLRIVTCLLFLDLTAHFVVRSLEFSRARVSPTPDNEQYKWSIPLTVVGNVTTTFAGLLSDGLLVWRFYIIYCQRKWALYVPGVAVVLNALLCLSADMQHLAIYHNKDFYEERLLKATLNITVAWGWFMFALNTMLTTSIIARVFYIANKSASTLVLSSLGRYSTVFRAIVESALVTWVGLLIYEISSLAPAGHVTTNYDIGYVMLCIIPIFFGISQCLITARIGLTREVSVPGGTSISRPSSSFPRTSRATVPNFARTISSDVIINIADSKLHQNTDKGFQLSTTLSKEGPEENIELALADRETRNVRYAF